MPVAASEHTVELQSGNTYWYGQLLEYNDAAVNSGDNWTLKGVTSGNSTTVSASQDGTVTFDPTNLATDSANLQAEDIELVNPSGTVVLTASIDFQTLTPQSFTNDPVYDAGSDTTTSIDINSNRSNYTYDRLSLFKKQQVVLKVLFQRKTIHTQGISRLNYKTRTARTLLLKL
jgi:hypothetical protein